MNFLLFSSFFSLPEKLARKLEEGIGPSQELKFLPPPTSRPSRKMREYVWPCPRPRKGRASGSLTVTTTANKGSAMPIMHDFRNHDRHQSCRVSRGLSLIARLGTATTATNHVATASSSSSSTVICLSCSLHDRGFYAIARTTARSATAHCVTPMVRRKSCPHSLAAGALLVGSSNFPAQVTVAFKESCKVGCVL